MSRATTKSKPTRCIIMKRRPPHSTSAPSLIERPLTGAHHHASPSIQRTPSRILFAPFWRLLYVSRILFAVSQTHKKDVPGDPVFPMYHTLTNSDFRECSLLGSQD